MRTDVHSPSNIIPSDYEYVAVWTMNIQGIGDSLFMLRERELVHAHMERTNGTYAHVETSGSCQVCGNVQAIFLALFHHAKTNTYVRVGFDCTRKLEMSGDFAAFNQFRRNVSDAREAQAGKRKAIAILGDLSLLEAWEIYTAETVSNQYEERTITDIIGKLVKYGNISEKASAFVKSLLNRIADRPLIEAQRQAEKDAALPVPTGRVELIGEVVGMKTVECQAYSYYGPTEQTKLIIRLENGSKVYGNRFANLERGDKVHFVATVEASKDDTKFGFYKRPFLYQSPIQKKAIKVLSHAYEAMRSVQIKEFADVRTAEGIDAACDTLYSLWQSIQNGNGENENAQ